MSSTSCAQSGGGLTVSGRTGLVFRTGRRSFPFCRGSRVHSPKWPAAGCRWWWLLWWLLCPLVEEKKHKDKHRFSRSHDRDYSRMKSELDAGWGRASCAAFSSGVATVESVSHKVRGENSCSIIQVTWTCAPEKRKYHPGEWGGKVGAHTTSCKGRSRGWTVLQWVEVCSPRGGGWWVLGGDRERCCGGGEDGSVWGGAATESSAAKHYNIPTFLGSIGRVRCFCFDRGKPWVQCVKLYQQARAHTQEASI